MMQEEVIRRLGAMVNHNKLGFTANAMFVCKADKARVIKIGRHLAELPIVSHCYERSFDKLRTSKARYASFACWPYNLFAMMHGRTLDEIRGIAEKFAREHHLSDWELLVTNKRLLYNTGRK